MSAPATLSHSTPLSAFRREARATLLLGWPLILSQLAQMAINTTDVVMMGWLGPEELGAGALASNIYVPLLMLGIGLGVAVSAMVAQARGANPHSVRDVRRSLRAGLWATAALALPAMVVLWNIEPLLRLIGQDAALSAMASDYMRAMLWGFLPAIWFITLRAFVSSLERTGVVLIVALGAVVLNAVSNWVFMFGNLGAPRLELVGAGISSTLANSAMFGALLAYCYLDRRLKRYAVLGRFWRADWPRLVETLRLGAPISGMLIFEVGVFNMSVFMAGLLGPANLAAHAIALQIASAAFMVPLGLSQATTVRVGLAAGRRDRAATSVAGWTSIGLALAFMCGTAALMFALPELLVSAFVSQEDGPEVAALAVSFLMIAGVFQLVDGVQIIAASALRGLKDTRVPMIIAGVSYWGVGLTTAVFLGFRTELGGFGIWIGLALGLTVAAVWLTWRWTRREALGLV